MENNHYDWETVGDPQVGQLSEKSDLAINRITISIQTIATEI